MTKQDMRLATARVEHLNSCFRNQGMYNMTACLTYVVIEGCKMLYSDYIAEIESRYNLKFDRVLYSKDGIRAMFKYA